MGSRLGSVANVGYVTAVENDAVNGANWLSDREAGLRASAPLQLQLLIAGRYGTVDLLAMTAVDSVQTASVHTIPALCTRLVVPRSPRGRRPSSMPS